MTVPFYKPSLPPYELVEKDFREAYQSGMLAPGKFTERFASAAANYLGVKHAIPFSSCSDAMMCLVGYIKDLTGKDKVIIPDFTFASTWQAVDWNGMWSVPVDVDCRGLLDPMRVEKYLKTIPGIGCIFAVHMFGQPADIEALEELSYKYRVILIFDTAHGFGSLYKGDTLGGNGLAEVFSLGTTKPLSAGEGGLLTCGDDHLANVMTKAAMHGHRLGELDVECKSLNGRIQEINSIMAYHGLTFLEANMRKRQASAALYDEAFKDQDLIVPVPVRGEVRSSYKDYTVCCHNRNSLKRFLDSRGIQTRIYYQPTVRYLMDNKSWWAHSELEPRVWQSKKMADNCLSLPFFTKVTSEQQLEVIDAIKEYYEPKT